MQELRRCQDEEPQTNTQEQKQIRYESDDTQSVNTTDYMRLWLLAFAKALVIVIPVLFFLWLYFLPALVLSKEYLQVVRDLLYVHVRSVLYWVSFFGFIIVNGIRIFGFHFCKQPLVICGLPGLMANILLDLFFSSVIFNYLVLFVAVVLSIVLVYRAKPPENPSVAQIIQAQRNKLIIKPLGKIVLVTLLFYLIFNILYPIFLNIGFQGKALIRFIILPIMMTSCMGLQMHFLKHVPREHVDYVIPTIWISSGYLKMYERIFTNSMFNSGDYIYFLAATLVATLIEIANHATFFYRIALVEKLVKYISRLGSRDKRAVNNFSMIPTSDADHKPPQHPSHVREDEWVVEMRRKLIIEDVSTELVMIFTVTVLFYLIHPLLDDDRVETIPSLETCIVQLIIQISLEFVSDGFGLYWTISKHRVHIRKSDIQIHNEWFWVWFFFMLYQPLNIFLLFISYQ
eukprot:TRINITY_DN9879_c0_g1_i1.p1 TRINITY_DN9879_c0_g1~~TRINITY_DN9879_c0_g1_i1.p1  ORF type:complete len:458 (+),score=100.81 TRINITY_DN9879_c0_g1_i1:81-1454(+)